jgi:hypothetical protein
MEKARHAPGLFFFGIEGAWEDRKRVGVGFARLARSWDALKDQDGVRIATEPKT